MTYKFGLILLYCFLFSKPAIAERSALVIVDMQDSFLVDAYNYQMKETYVLKRLKSSLLNLIRIAKRNQAPIFLIEYQNYGPTIEEILKELEGYPLTYNLEKTTDGVFDDRSNSKLEMHRTLKGLNVRRLIFSGVNGSACVCDSINGALDLGYQVTAYPPAIGSFGDNYVFYPYWSSPNFIPQQENYSQTNRPQKVEALFSNKSNKQLSCGSFLQ